MKFIIILFSSLFLASCSQPKNENINFNKQEDSLKKHAKIQDDGRISLHLNPKQKNHQLKNMRSHLEAVQNIILLLSENKFNEASEIAYEKLGSTTEMKLMCASFGNENFENLGIEFHKSADELSEIIKQKDKERSLKALATTMNYCIQCHTTFKQ